LRLLVSDAVNPSDWDAQVVALGGTLFHSSAWARYRCGDGTGRPLFFRWYGDSPSEPAAVGLGIERPGPATLVGRLASRVDFDSPPASPEDGRDYVTSIAHWARGSRSVVEITLGSFDARTTWSPGGPPRPVRRIEFLVDPGPREELLRRIRSGSRGSIRQAQKHGVRVEVAEAPSQLRGFASLYQTMLRRLERTKGIPMPAVKPAVFAKTLSILVEERRARLYLASLDDELLAGCFFGTFNRAAFYLFNGSTDRALKTGATPLILLTALEELSADGVERINLGGVPFEAQAPESSDHGLYEFKLGFGTRPVVRLSGSLATRRARALAVKAARKAVRR
jgi:hypothetical protein